MSDEKEKKEKIVLEKDDEEQDKNVARYVEPEAAESDDCCR